MARSSFNGQKEGIKNSVTKSMARRAAVGKTIAAKFGGAKGSKAKGGTAGGGG
jgi:hypothetical protein